MSLLLQEQKPWISEIISSTLNFIPPPATSSSSSSSSNYPRQFNDRHVTRLAQVIEGPKYIDLGSSSSISKTKTEPYIYLVISDGTHSIPIILPPIRVHSHSNKNKNNANGNFNEVGTCIIQKNREKVIHSFKHIQKGCLIKIRYFTLSTLKLVLPFFSSSSTTTSSTEMTTTSTTTATAASSNSYTLFLKHLNRIIHSKHQCNQYYTYTQRSICLIVEDDDLNTILLWNQLNHKNSNNKKNNTNNSSTNNSNTNNSKMFKTMDPCLESIGCEGMSVVGDPYDIHLDIHIKRLIQALDHKHSSLIQKQILSCYNYDWNYYHSTCDGNGNDGDKDGDDGDDCHKIVKIPGYKYPIGTFFHSKIYETNENDGSQTQKKKNDYDNNKNLNAYNVIKNVIELYNHIKNGKNNDIQNDGKENEESEQEMEQNMSNDHEEEEEEEFHDAILLTQNQSIMGISDMLISQESNNEPGHDNGNDNEIEDGNGHGDGHGDDSTESEAETVQKDTNIQYNSETYHTQDDDDDDDSNNNCLYNTSQSMDDDDENENNKSNEQLNTQQSYTISKDTELNSSNDDEGQQRQRQQPNQKLGTLQREESQKQVIETQPESDETSQLELQTQPQPQSEEIIQLETQMQTQPQSEESLQLETQMQTQPQSEESLQLETQMQTQPQSEESLQLETQMQTQPQSEESLQLETQIQTQQSVTQQIEIHSHETLQLETRSRETRQSETRQETMTQEQQLEESKQSKSDQSRKSSISKSDDKQDSNENIKFQQIWKKRKDRRRKMAMTSDLSQSSSRCSSHATSAGSSHDDYQDIHLDHYENGDDGEKRLDIQQDGDRVNGKDGVKMTLHQLSDQGRESNTGKGKKVCSGISYDDNISNSRNDGGGDENGITPNSDPMSLDDIMKQTQTRRNARRMEILKRLKKTKKYEVKERTICGAPNEIERKNKKRKRGSNLSIREWLKRAKEVSQE